MWKNVDGGDGRICVRHVFCNAADDLQSGLHAEAALNTDMLFLDCQEGYGQGMLTRKLIATMQMFLNNSQDLCINRPLFFKTDDDTFVAGLRFRQFLQTAWDKHGQSMYAGVSVANTRVIRDMSNPWYEPLEVFGATYYPPTMRGGPGYILGRSTIEHFFAHRFVDAVLWNEDRAVGVWVDKARKSGLPIAEVEVPGSNGYWWDHDNVRSGSWLSYPYILHHKVSEYGMACLLSIDIRGNGADFIDSCFAK